MTDPDTVIVVPKGNLDNVGEHRRYMDACTIMSFVAEVLGGYLYMGKSSAVLRAPTVTGDASRVDREVVAYVDIQRADVPSEIPGVVERLMARLDASGVPPELVGVDLAVRHLERMYMRYDVHRWCR